MTESEIRLRRSGRSRPLGRFWRAGSGATAVEFALVATPLFFLLLCIVELGLMLFAGYMLQQGVQEAGRQLRLGKVTTAAEVREAVCRNALILQGCATELGSSVASGTSFAALAAPDFSTMGPGSNVFNLGGTQDAVVMAVTYDWTFFTPFMRPLGTPPGAGTRRLSAVAVFRNEP